MHSVLTAPVNQTSNFLGRASIEITGKQIEKVPLLQQHLPKGTRVFVALIEAGHLEHQIDACVALHKSGFIPVPHIPARFVSDTTDLDHRLSAFTKRQV